MDAEMGPVRKAEVHCDRGDCRNVKTSSLLDFNSGIGTMSWAEREKAIVARQAKINHLFISTRVSCRVIYFVNSNLPKSN